LLVDREVVVAAAHVLNECVSSGDLALPSVFRPRIGRNLRFNWYLFVRPMLRMDKAAWTECHVEAFAFFGGAPARLVPDYVARAT
jgi:hypothetical protein